MSRTVSQTLLDAISNQQGETILRVKTWATLAAYNLAPTVPERTWETNKFKIEATEAEAWLITDNDYTLSDFTVFIIERGVTLAGTEYVVQSGIYFVSNYIETDGRLRIKGSSFPDQKIVIAGDDTYQTVITDFCTEIGKTAVFKDTGAAWLAYQFLPAGKQVILNKAERFENLIRQKYLIQCYERSPKELVFYHATTEQSVWKDIIFADSQLVLSAASGSHEIANSTDGLAYTKIDAPSFTNSIAYSPTLDLFAAVGNGVCITSPDGVTWTSRTIGTGNWTGITWDATLAKFVATASDQNPKYSSNGTTWTAADSWTSRTTPESNAWRSVCWSPSLSLFVAVSGDGTNRVMTSPDGTTWTARAAAEANQWQSVCWSPELDLFVAVSYNGTNRVMTSSNGTAWTARAAAEANQWQSVCWSPELSLFVAVSDNGTNRVMTSPDGTTWTARAAAGSISWNGVCWSPELDLFVAVGITGVMTSSNGVAWTARTAAEANSWSSVCWSPELSLFVAIGYTGTNRVMTSPDGTNWTARAAAEANSWGSVCWSPSLSLFLAVSVSGTNRVMTSPDGTTWTARAAAEANQWQSVCWSPELSLFVAVGYYSSTGAMTSSYGGNPSSFLGNSITSNNAIFATVGTALYTSSNGLFWTPQTIPAGTYHKLIYADSLFVAVGASVCATSPDGITWTARTIPAGTYTGLAYSSALDLFVAVGENLLATSPDGITWTSRTPPADQAWQAVAWSDTLAQFFAVSSDGDNRIASSEDGINWQILTTQADYSFSYLDGPKSSIEHGTNTVHFISRDETASVNTSGDTAYPAWNLGYLESTDAAPGTNSDPFYKFFLQKAPLRLDVTDGDRIHFEPSWTLDPTKAIDAMITIVESFDSTQSPAWYQEIRSLALFASVEGGALPSTIERVAAYTPLVSSGFDGNLSPSVNNLQALAEAVDDLPASGGGTWGSITGTLSTQTDLQTALDAKEATSNKATAMTGNTTSNIVFLTAKAIYDWAVGLFSQIGHTHTGLVTNGDSHDHNGGDGAQIAYSSLSGTPTIREVLTANRTYYVRTDGSDSNNGLANTAGGAFLTIQKAVNVVAALDLSTYDVTIQVGNGTYTEAVELKTLIGAGLVTILGDATTPSNVVVTQAVTNGACFGITIPARWKVKGLKLTATGTSGRCVSVIGAATSLLIEKIDFGTATVHIFVTNGGYLEADGDYSITAGADYHWDAIDGIIHMGASAGGTNTITLTGTPAFASGFVLSTRLGYVRCNSTTFSGAATGTRYTASVNGVIFTGGGGASFIPGNVAGSTATGGQYI